MDEELKDLNRKEDQIVGYLEDLVIILDKTVNYMSCVSVIFIFLR